MRSIEKFLILAIIISAFLPHTGGSILILMNMGLAVQWLALRFNAVFSGFFLALAVITASLIGNRLKKTTLVWPNFNSLDFFVAAFFLVIGSFTGLIGLIYGNSLIYTIGDTYLYLAFGVTYFLSAFIVSKKGIFKIIDLIAYYIFFLMMLPETAYKIALYLSTGGFNASGIVYYLLPFIYFFSKYDFKPSKKTFLLFTSSAFMTILTLYRTLGMAMVAVLFLKPIISLRAKKSYMKIASVFAVFVIIAFSLQATNILPLFGRYDLTNYYHSFFDPEWSDKRDARVTEAISAFYTMRDNNLSYFWGMGQGAVADMTNNEGYEELFQFDGDGGETEIGKVHSIHLTLASVFFRTGLLGLSLFISFLFFSGIFLFKRLRAAKSARARMYLEIVFFYFFISVIYSFSRYGIINDLVLASFLGLARNPNLLKNDSD